jgi:uncharacterized protein
MSHTKYISTLLLPVLFLALAASCQSNRSKPGNPGSDSSIQKQDPSKVPFRDYIPEARSYVNDYDLIYEPNEVKTMDSLILDFENRTTMQVALITFTAQMLEKGSIEAMTIRVANAWSVGQKEKNNGVIIGICRECRKMTIRNGLGTEKILSDEETKQIIDKAFIPYFKNDDHYGGTLNGLKVLMDTLGKKLLVHPL